MPKVPFSFLFKSTHRRPLLVFIRRKSSHDMGVRRRPEVRRCLFLISPNIESAPRNLSSTFDTNSYDASYDFWRRRRWNSNILISKRIHFARRLWISCSSRPHLKGRLLCFLCALIPLNLSQDLLRTIYIYFGRDLKPNCGCDFTVTLKQNVKIVKKNKITVYQTQSIVLKVDV